MLWSRLHLVQGIRIVDIDADEQREHVRRFLEYLGGRALTPRDAQDVAQIELHHDDGVVILDLSDVDESLVARCLPPGRRSSSGSRQRWSVCWCWSSWSW
jgi:hypothetical protein